MANSVMIFGAGNLAKAALEIFKSNDIVVYCFLTDDKTLQGTEIDDIAVMGPTDNDSYLKYIGKQSEAFIALEENKDRKRLVSLIKDERKTMPINGIHSKANIASTAVFGHGNMVNLGATIGAGAQIGSHNIINANATVDYSAIIGDYVQIGSGSTISPAVTVEDNVFISSGVTIMSGVKIGKRAKIGPGSVVMESVKAGDTVFGNPAKPIK